MSVTPVIPAELHGFSVELRLGPYPADQPLSHRRAMYAVLRPNTDESRRKLHHIGRQEIHGCVPLMPGAAEYIDRHPQSRIAERAATDAVRAAAALARRVEAA